MRPQGEENNGVQGKPGSGFSDYRDVLKKYSEVKSTEEDGEKESQTGEIPEEKTLEEESSQSIESTRDEADKAEEEAKNTDPADTEEMKEQIGKLSGLVSKLRNQVDKDNAAKGKLGQELKAREAVIEDLKRKLLKESAVEEKPDIKVDAPDLPDFYFDDEMLDDRTKDALKKQHEYLKSLAKANALSQKEVSRYDKVVSELKREIAELKSGFQDVENMKKEVEGQKKSSAYNAEMEKLFSEIETLQEKYPELKTSIPAKEINQKILEANGQREIVEAYFSTLDKKDKQAWEQIISVGSLYKPFDAETGSFKKNPAFKNIDSAYLIHQHNEGKLSPQKIAEQRIEEMRKQQTTNSPGVSEVSPSQVGNTSGFEERAGEQESNRFKEISDILRSNPKAILQNPRLQTEYQQLKKKLFGKTLAKY